MTGITDPSEEYFKDGLWGWVTDAWVKIVAEAAGQLHVYLAGQAADVEVKQQVPSDLLVGACGWGGASWYKLPMVFGYSAPWQQQVAGAAAGTGDATATTTAVVEHYVYVLQALSMYHDAGVPKDTRAYVLNDTVGVILLPKAELGIASERVWQGEVLLAEGDVVVANCYAPGAGKEVTLKVWGYKMQIVT